MLRFLNPNIFKLGVYLGEPLVESKQECTQNGDDHSREIIPEILNKEKAAEVTGQESDQDEENLLHSEGMLVFYLKL